MTSELEAIKQRKTPKRYLVSYKFIKQYSAEEMANQINVTFSNASQEISNLVASATAVKAYKIRYRTQNVKGRRIIVSGLVVFPDPDDGRFPVLQYQHCTQFDRWDVPSNLLDEGAWEAPSVMALFAAHGYIVSMPDYIGQGKSRGFHPYLHKESMAISSADMLNAVQELCQRLEIETDSKLFISGFSQGGHAAMALHEYIESNAGAQPFQLVASAPIDGPYDLSSCWDHFCHVNDSFSFIVASRIYLAYKKIYRFRAKAREVFVFPYNRKIQKVFNGKNDETELKGIFKDDMNKMMSKKFLDMVAAGEHPLSRELAQNNTCDFLPIAPIRFYHSPKDNIVPYEISETACENMKNLGAVDVEVIDSGDYNPGTFHAGSFVNSTLMAKVWFDSF